MTYQIPLDMDLIVDNFAGGGGASVGIEMALQRPVNIAVNHDQIALGMHHINHPLTTHYCDDVWQVNPREVTKGRPVMLAWFSPDCKHHSKARGQKPVNKNIRGLAWVALRWAATVKPRIIMLENVEEFQDWGPVVQALDENGHKRFNPDGTPIMMPCPKGKGINFRSFVRALERHGYKVEWRQLRACDYGAPTIRKRLFLIARCDGQAIVWPAPTHAKNPVKGSGLKPYRTAAECIDWDLVCPSIFGRKKSLADNTMKRIAKGMHKFVLTNADPFIVTVNHTASYYDQFRGQAITDPLATCTHKNGFAVAQPKLAPFITEHANGSTQRNFSADEALRTLCAQVKGGHFAAVAPILASLYGAKSDNDHRCHEFTDLVPTVTASARHALLAPSLIQVGYGEREGQAPRVPGLDKPLGTVVAGGGKHAVMAAYLAQHNSVQGDDVNGGRPASEPFSTLLASGSHQMPCAVFLQRQFGTSTGQIVDTPMGTATTKNKTSLCAAHLMKFRYDSAGADLRHPAPTVTAGSFVKRPGGAGHAMGLCAAFVSKMRGDNVGHMPTEGLHTVSAGGTHHALSLPFLTKYYGSGDGKEPHTVDKALGAVTTKDRFGLIDAQVEVLEPLQAEQLDRARQVAALLRQYGWWDDREFVTVEIKGHTYMVVDIGMRMLTPRELARAQGFPDDYVIDRALILDAETGLYTEKALTKSEQVRMIGNSVCPPLSAALASANVQRAAMIGERKTA